MKILKRALLWVAGVLAVLVLAVVGLVTWFTVRGERQIAEQEIVDRHAEAPGAFFTVEGHEYHAVIRGDLDADPTRAPILFVHGFGPTGSNVILPLANELAAGRSVIVPDMLGFGYSEKVSEPGAHFTVEGRANALLGLLDVLGVEQFDVVGHSFGGSGKRPAGPGGSEPGASRGACVSLRSTRRRRRGISWRICPEPRPASPSGVRLAVGPAASPAEPGATDPAACDALRIAQVEGTVDALLAINNTPRAYALPGELPNVQQPALVIWGDDDAIVPPEFSARAAHAMDADSWIVPGGGHWPFAIDPAGVTERIRSFLAVEAGPEAVAGGDAMP